MDENKRRQMLLQDGNGRKEKIMRREKTGFSSVLIAMVGACFNEKRNGDNGVDQSCSK